MSTGISCSWQRAYKPGPAGWVIECDCSPEGYFHVMVGTCLSFFNWHRTGVRERATLFYNRVETRTIYCMSGRDGKVSKWKFSQQVWRDARYYSYHATRCFLSHRKPVSRSWQSFPQQNGITDGLITLREILRRAAARRLQQQHCLARCPQTRANLTNET